MRTAEMNWRQIEDWVRHDDRAVLPLGSTEQHAGLSLATDAILAERVAVEAAEPLGIPVFPVVPFGLTPYLSAFPGTVTLRLATYAALMRDLLDSLKRSGFRRILIVNGHAGNQPAALLAQEWMMDNPDARVRFHNWWQAPLTHAAVQAVDPVATHASWMENFPWTRLPETDTPADAKVMADLDHIRTVPPFEAREALGDGNFGGLYRRSDADMTGIWNVSVAETRALLESW